MSKAIVEIGLCDRCNHTVPVVIIQVDIGEDEPDTQEVCMDCLIKLFNRATKASAA